MCPVTLGAIGSAIVSAVSSVGAGGAAAAGSSAIVGATSSAVAAGTAAAATTATAAAAGLGSTVKTVGTALSLASTLLGGVSAYQQGQAQSKAAIIQQQQDQLRARDALERGEAESDRHRLAAARAQGEQKARAAAAGVDISTGSALDLLDDSAFIAEQDAFTIRKNATRSSDGYLVSAANAGTAATAARRQGLFDAGGTVLTGASRVASRWQAFQTGDY